MRRIGNFENKELAFRFCDFLLTESIEAFADQRGEDDASWEIWIRDEEDVEVARKKFTLFEANPNASEFDVGSKAESMRDQRVNERQRKIAEQKKLIRSMPASRTGGAMGGAGRIGGSNPLAKQQNIPITLAVIVLSAIASFGSDFGKPRLPENPSKVTTQEQIFLQLSFVDFRDYVESNGDWFASVRKGQIWRFLTPMFLHADPFHLVFNMIWIYLLGSAIERLHGSVFFAVLLLLSEFAGTGLQVMLPAKETLPELLQALSGSAFAIGASGAVYGLFGYLWIRPHIEPSYPIQLSQGNIMLMLGWLVLCMTGMVGPIANGGHLGGLIAGMVIAYFVANKKS